MNANVFTLSSSQYLFAGFYNTIRVGNADDLKPGSQSPQNAFALVDRYPFNSNAENLYSTNKEL